MKNDLLKKGQRKIDLKMNKNKRGQVWVETLIYTLIAFVMMGIVLYFAGPRINQAQDKAIIDQTVNVMEDINAVISSIGIPGNKRLVELTLKEGELKIDAEQEKIIFEMESEYEYSQSGEEIEYGGIIAYTEEKGNFYLVRLTSDYSNSYNITYRDEHIIKTITKSPAPYNLFITNQGSSPIIINFELG